MQALDDFMESGLMSYAEHRDRPDMKQTSYLSPYLQSGDIGPRQIWHTVRSHAAGDSRFATGSEAFLRQLVWREFARELLHQSPRLAQVPLQAGADRISWRSDPEAFRRWTRGETGYPLVDAGMRQLWRTGWIHNRVRMVVASFLVKHLLIDWRQGEAWFWDSLVDADHASNAMNWQWVAGCGVDAAPWFRIFNPVLQGHRFDPDGAYVRRWVPELARVPARFIHQPWRAPETTQRAAGLRLDADYPRPMVDHAAARQRALAAYSLASGPSRSPRRQSRGGTPARP
jgi:deoxyribodipyrimidine photo-lyase